MATLLASSGVGGARFSPRRISGLLSYYDPDQIETMVDENGAPVAASGDHVARWMDSGGAAQAYDLVSQDPSLAYYAQFQSVGINSMPAVQLLGQNSTTGKQSLLYNVSYGGSDTGVGLPGMSQITLMLVAKVTHSANDTVCFLSATKDGANPNFSPNGFVVQTPGSATSLQLLKDSGIPGGINFSKSITSSPALYTLIFDNTDPGSGTGSGIFYVNGGSPGSDTDSGAGSTITLDAICFGARCDTLASAMDYYVRDIAIYTRRLSLPELDALGSWMMAKIGATGALSPFEAP